MELTLYYSAQFCDCALTSLVKEYKTHQWKNLRKMTSLINITESEFKSKLKKFPKVSPLHDISLPRRSKRNLPSNDILATALGLAILNGKYINISKFFHKVSKSDLEYIKSIIKTSYQYLGDEYCFLVEYIEENIMEMIIHIQCTFCPLKKCSIKHGTGFAIQSRLMKEHNLAPTAITYSR